MTVGPPAHGSADAPRGLGASRGPRARPRACSPRSTCADPAGVLGRYPHQLSGGQQQRIVIAMALIAEPALLIMDEPTTGLDVTVEAAVLDLVRALRQRHDSAILFISHNLGTVARVCDRVGVMYGGELVEEGTIRQVFANPRHPYTRGLLDCLPTLGRDKREAPLVPDPGPGRLARARARRLRVRGALCSRRARPRASGRRSPSAACRATGHRVRCVRAAELAPWARARRPSRPPPTARPPGRPTRGRRPASGRSTGRARLARRSARAPCGRSTRSISMRPKARTLAIVGESGCGKSTLARVLSGLETASGGPGPPRRHRGRRAWRSTGGRARSSASSRWSSRTPTARSTRATRWAMRSAAPSAGCAACRARRRGGRSRASSRSSSCRRSWPAGSPTSSRGARSSASPSPGRWPAIPT